ncbi:MAG: hypothetical protein JRM80_01545 [Nitrososphaerota archaeon]|nr:hypothetical protein [Nitrososphaerota archaeon]
MTPIDELSSLLAGPSRVVVIASKDVDLKSLAGENELVLMKILEGSLAAGGRGGGFGERRVVMVAHFRYHDGTCEKLHEAGDEGRAAGFEVPFHVARMPVVLRDGTDAMGYGVVDEELVKELASKLAGLPTA